MRKIPVKVVFTGDQKRCQAVMREAESRLVLLEQRLDRGNLQQGWQRPITLKTGEVITLAVFFGMSVIQISAGDEDVPGGDEPKACLCNCNFSVGVVLKVVNQMELNSGAEEAPLLIVSICKLKKKYVAYHNILGSDFTPWYPGQQVLVLAYHEFKFNCCVKLEPSTGCLPMVDYEYKTQTGDVDRENSSWRTTYRVLPINASSLGRWIPR